MICAWKKYCWCSADFFFFKVQYIISISASVYLINEKLLIPYKIVLQSICFKFIGTSFCMGLQLLIVVFVPCVANESNLDVDGLYYITSVTTGSYSFN